MSRIAILADSGCQIAINEIPGVYIVPLQVIINEKTYLDEVDIDSKTVFEMMRKDKLLLPKTSQPSSGAIVEAITQLKEDGYDEVLAITIATGLSSTLSGVHLACEMEKIPVTLIDSKGTAGNHKYLVEVALQLINEGKSREEIKPILEDLVDHSATIIMTSNLDHLKRGGRITPAVAMLANMLKIIPVMKLNMDLGGKIDVLTKVRTVKKANLTIMDHMLSCGVNAKDYILTMEHVLCDEFASQMLAELKKKIGQGVEVAYGLLPSVVGVHMGIGGIGYQYIKKYQSE